MYNKALTDKTEIFKKTNEFSTNIEPNLAGKNLKRNKIFVPYIAETETLLTFFELTEDEFETSFKSLNIDKTLDFYNDLVISI